jgi:hypothetical protein
VRVVLKPSAPAFFSSNSKRYVTNVATFTSSPLLQVFDFLVCVSRCRSHVKKKATSVKFRISRLPPTLHGIITNHDHGKRVINLTVNWVSSHLKTTFTLPELNSDDGQQKMLYSCYPAP